MTEKDIYEYAIQKYPEVVERTVNGATPIDTLSSNLYPNIKKLDSSFSKFKEGTSATRFGLKVTYCYLFS